MIEYLNGNWRQLILIILNGHLLICRKWGGPSLGCISLYNTHHIHIRLNIIRRDHAYAVSQRQLFNLPLGFFFFYYNAIGRIVWTVKFPGKKSHVPPRGLLLIITLSTSSSSSYLSNTTCLRIYRRFNWKYLNVMSVKSKFSFVFHLLCCNDSWVTNTS